MSPLRYIAIAAAAFAVAIAGCGVGEGEAEPGQATLTVTRDHGTERLLGATLADPTASETVVRFLDREAEIETSYSGNFVDSIEGLAGRSEGGRREDWFFYVNGYWSPVGAGEAEVRAGDRIWWDYRDWTDAYRVSAVVGSYPEPFRSGFDGERYPTEVVCFAAEVRCDQVAERLGEQGVEAGVVAAGGSVGDPEGTLRVLVGEWAELRSDPAASLLERGPDQSGVYAVPERCDGGWALSVRDERAAEAGSLPDGAWVAALRRGEEQPTWVVSSSDEDGLAAAIELLDPEVLADRYAVAASAGSGEPIALPAGEAAEPDLPGGC